MPDLLILGGGLSGLSAAYHSHRDHLLVERESRPGGHTRSETIDGFTFDYGPHILYPKERSTADLIRERLSKNLLIQERQAFVYHDSVKRYTRFPFQNHLFGLDRKVVKDCIMGAFEAHRLRDGEKPRNYRDWVEKTFGSGIAFHLYVPYSEKLWTVPLETMNFDWIERRVPLADLEQIVDGALSESSGRFGFNKVFWYPERGGIEELPKGFIPSAGEIMLEAEVVRVERKQHLVHLRDGRRIDYGALISTIPLPAFIPLVDGVPEPVKKAATELLHNSILCVNLGIDRKDISPYQWVYLYEDAFDFHRLSFPMNFNDSVVPPGTSSISTEIAYSRFRPIEKEGVVERTIQQLIRAGILLPEDRILCSQVLDIPFAYVIYDLSHRKNQRIVRSWLLEQGIFPYGRYGEWEYFNMDHSIESGIRAASAAAAYLESRP